MAHTHDGQGVVPLTEQQIELRNSLANSTGFVLRKCSLCEADKRPRTFLCWENRELDHEYCGAMVSSLHCVAKNDGCVCADRPCLDWPPKVIKEAVRIEAKANKKNRGKK